MQQPGRTAAEAVIIGAGHGGCAVAGYLRQFGVSGRIVMVGEESAIPYQRPPLSKAWLNGEMSLEQLAIRPARFYSQQSIDLESGVRAERIDPDRREVRLSNGEVIAYQYLILAMGAVARTLPSMRPDLPNVLTLRKLADADALRGCLVSGKRMAIIGGGYVGLEVAATATGKGVEVVVLEKAARLLERVASAPAGEFLSACHRRRGVDIQCAVEIRTIHGDGRAEAVELADGRIFPCDAVVIGIGARPVVDLAADAGLACSDGVDVDEHCRTSIAGIFAVGDMVNRVNPSCGRRIRIESLPSANEQARIAAAAIAGKPMPPAEIPWFWSDQYELKLQMAGLPAGSDALVVRGSAGDGKLAVYHVHGKRILAVEAINSPPDFLTGKKLIAAGVDVNLEKLADARVTLDQVTG